MNAPHIQDMSTRTLLRPESWAAGHRAALAVVVELDSVPGSERPSAPFNDAAGADRLLNMLADFDIPPTAVVAPDGSQHVPIPDGLAVDGAVHADTEPDLDRAGRIVSERLGTDLRGVVLSDGAMAEGAGAGDLWVLERRPASAPQLTGDGTVVIPSHSWWDAASWFNVNRPSPPSAMLESWSIGLAAVRTHGDLMVIRVSARVAGLPGTVETVQRFLDEAVGAGDVWITNVSAVAGHSRSAAQE